MFKDVLFLCLFDLCLIYIFICVCFTTPRARSVSVPPHTGLRPTCFWGKEDKREINCSTSSPATALLLREQFVGWRTSEGLKAGEGAATTFGVPGRSCDPAVDFGWHLCPLLKCKSSVFHRRRNATSVKVQLFQTIPRPPSLSPLPSFLDTDTFRSGPVTRWQKTELTSTTWHPGVLPLLFSLLTSSLLILLLPEPCLL